MTANFTPNMSSITDMKPFRFWCQKVLPTVYDDSLSYYELLNKVVNYLNETVDNVDLLNDNVTRIFDAYVLLQDYVNDYFDQEFPQLVEDKLDEMAEDGTLTALIKGYIDPYFEGKSEEIDARISEQDSTIASAISAQNNVLQTQNSNIGVIDSRMSAFISNHAGLVGEVTLWEGSSPLRYENTTVALEDNVSNYAYIDVYYNHRGKRAVQRFQSSDALNANGFYIRDTETERAPGDTPQMYPYFRTMQLKLVHSLVSDVSNITLVENSESVWDGSFTVNPGTSLDSSECYITKIVGANNVQNDAEIVDARVGYDNSVYLSIGDAIRGQASEINSALYEFKRFLQCGFANGSRTNQQSGTYINTDATYTVHSVNKIKFEEDTTLKVASGFEVRRYWYNPVDHSFVSFDGSWFQTSINFLKDYEYHINIRRVNYDSSEVANVSEFLQKVYTTIDDIDLNPYVKSFGVNLTNSNVQDVCSGDLNNLQSNIVYAVASNLSALHKPPLNNQGFTIISLTNSSNRYNTTGTVQLAVYSFGNVYCRSYWNSAWSEWEPIIGSRATRVLAFGDSICAGGRNNDKGFVGLLGLPYKNDGVSGACISSVRGTGDKWIEYSMQNEADTDFNCVIVNGGINDYIYSAPLGVISSKPIRYTDSEYGSLNTGTVIGALEHLFALMIHKYPNASKYFLISHKTRNYPWTVHFDGGYTQQELHDAIVNVCNLYNIIVIDVYENTNINTYFPEYYSPTPWSEDTSVGDLYFVDNDQVHPLNFGYIHGYVPLILEALKINQ